MFLVLVYCAWREHADSSFWAFDRHDPAFILDLALASRLLHAHGHHLPRTVILRYWARHPGLSGFSDLSHTASKLDAFAGPARPWTRAILLQRLRYRIARARRNRLCREPVVDAFLFYGTWRRFHASPCTHDTVQCPTPCIYVSPLPACPIWSAAVPPSLAPV